MLARVLLCMVVGFLLACGGDTHRGGGTFGGGVSGVWWGWCVVEVVMNVPMCSIYVWVSSFLNLLFVTHTGTTYVYIL